MLTVAELSEFRGSVRCDRAGFYRHRGRGLQLLLKTRAAQDGSALRRFKRHRGLRAAFRARCTGFSPDAPAARTFRLALLAVLGIVLELLVVKEKLLACGEHKFSPAVTTFQNPVHKFHGRFPKEGKDVARPST